MTAERFYGGAAPEAVPWTVLGEIFDSIFGPDVRDLRRYPDTLHHVHASWQDAEAVEHEAEALSEVEQAYSSYETARITFSGWRGDGKPCRFDYWPGREPVRARAFVQAAPDVIDAMIAPVQDAFPLQRVVVFISWSGTCGQRVAEAIRAVIEPRMPPAGEVFLSTRMRPGAPALTEMLEGNLLAADADVVVVTPEAAKSQWVTWETAATWARGKLVVPLFVDTQASDIGGPLTHVAQGVHLNDEEGLKRAIYEVVSAVGGNTDSPVSPDELASLRQAATDPS